MDGREYVLEGFEFYSEFDLEPVEFLKDAGDVVEVLAKIQAVEFWTS